MLRPGASRICLERVDRLKSLRKATIEMEMAYSKAWKIVKIAEENLGFPLLKSVTGGKGGGGAELTPEAARFLAAYRRLEAAVRSYADEAFVEIMGGWTSRIKEYARHAVYESTRAWKRFYHYRRQSGNEGLQRACAAPSATGRRESARTGC